jgi:hypothetical protein
MYILDVIKFKTKQLKHKLNPPVSSLNTTRHDVCFFQIGSLAQLEVYWKSVELGRGPAVILHVLDQYVMRFDCFGEKAGHAHFYMITPEKHCESRLFLLEKTVEAQIERAMFELSTNLNYWLARHRHPGVRRVRLNPAAVATAIEQARHTMLVLDQKIQAQSLMGVGGKL